MRTVCLTGLVLLLLCVLASPAPAAPVTSLGFVRLATGAEWQHPSAVREGLRRMTPDLLALRQKGAVLAYRPLLSVGLLQIEYRTGANLSSLRAGKVYASAQLALAGRQAPRGAARRSEATGPHFDVWMDGCYYAEQLGAYSQLLGFVYDRRGKLIATEVTQADGDGDQWDCFEDLGNYGPGPTRSENGGFGGGLLPGYNVVFKVYEDLGDSSAPGPEALLGTYSTGIPTFGVTAIDKANAVLRGVAPANKPYWVYWGHENLDVRDTDLEVEKEGTTTAAGTWARDMGTVAMRGWDWLEFGFDYTSRFELNTWMEVPALYCWAGFCEAADMPFTQPPLVLTRGGTSHTVPGLLPISASGYQLYALKDAEGVPLYIAKGDRIKVGTQPTVTVPAIVAKLSHTREQVYGTAPHPGFLETWLADVTDGYGSWYERRARTRNTGDYSLYYGDSLNLQHGRVYRLDLYHVNVSTGNGFGFRYVRMNPQ